MFWLIFNFRGSNFCFSIDIAQIPPITINLRELNICGRLCIMKNTKIRPQKNILLYGNKFIMIYYIYIYLVQQSTIHFDNVQINPLAKRYLFMQYIMYMNYNYNNYVVAIIIRNNIFLFIILSISYKSFFNFVTEYKYNSLCLSILSACIMQHMLLYNQIVYRCVVLIKFIHVWNYF